MLVLRESFYIYVRNLKTWLAQPWMIVAAVLSSAFMFLFFGEPLRGITALPGIPGRRLPGLPCRHGDRDGGGLSAAATWRWCC